MLLVNCEDDEGELVRRLQPILEHYGASYADVAPICMFSHWWSATTRRVSCWRPSDATGSCGRRRSMTR